MAFNEGGMASGLLIIAVSIVSAAGFGSQNPLNINSF